MLQQQSIEGGMLCDGRSGRRSTAQHHFGSDEMDDSCAVVDEPLRGTLDMQAVATLMVHCAIKL